MTLTVVELDGRNDRPDTTQLRRVLDLTLVLVSAPLWVPALAAIGVGVAGSSGFPIFFSQVRTGKDGTPFTMLKFRSMTSGSQSLIPSPDHITKFGRVLRRSSLDELPQLLNVIRGDMSLVGPRPMLPVQSKELTPSQHARHRVRPGMTGLAQVSGRNTITWSERIELDREWVDKPSVRSYLSILLRTFATVRDPDGTTGHSVSDPIARPPARKVA